MNPEDRWLRLASLLPVLRRKCYRGWHSLLQITHDQECCDARLWVPVAPSIEALLGAMREYGCYHRSCERYYKDGVDFMVTFYSDDDRELGGARNHAGCLATFVEAALAAL